MRQRWVGRSSFSTWLLSLNCECIYTKTCIFVFWYRIVSRSDRVVKDSVARGRDGWLFFFFWITHRLCLQGKEWVAAFSGPRLVLHTCLYSRIDLRALSHGWKRNERNTNLLFQLHRYLCATCVWRIWVKSVSCCVCMCARVFVSVCVCLCWMQKYSVHQLFFFFC